MQVNLFDYSKLSGNDQFFIWNTDKLIKYIVDPKDYNYKLKNLYVDEHILSIYTKNNYGLLLEPRCIKPDLYLTVEANIVELKKHYQKIITHDDKLLQLDKLFYELPFTGGCFILEKDIKIHPKTKLLSSVVSQKKETKGHLLRHRIAKSYAKYIDVYGPEYINLYVYPKCDQSNIDQYYNYVTGNLSRAYKEYMFSIVVENQKQDIFFTEKILNCFASGTIPIYWGAKKIDRFFNPQGIIQITDISDLDTILPSLSNKLYESKKAAIEENFILQFNYLSYDTHIRRALYG